MIMKSLFVLSEKAFCCYSRKMLITSKNNPLVKETASLKDKKGRKQFGMFLVEGRKMTEECLACGMEVDKIFVCEGTEFFFPVAEEKIVTVSEDVMRHISDEKTPQGVVCRVRIPQRELCPPKGNCLFLDGISDPGNMGAILRTANAAGYEEIYLTRECTDPYSPKSVRASMSGIFFTKLYFGDRKELISLMQNTGVKLVIADMGGSNVFEFVPPKHFALVIGNEANGISDEVAALVSDRLYIPPYPQDSPGSESLNAAIATAITVAEFRRRK